MTNGTAGDDAGVGALESLLRIGSERAEDLVSLVVAAAKEHLGMEMGFLAEFVGDEEVFRRVVGAAESFGIEEQRSVPIEEMYCHLMVEGRVPSVIADTTRCDIVKDMAVTRRAEVGCYIGVPVRLPGGRVYGTLCSIGHDANVSLGERDARFMRVLAHIVATELARNEEVERHRQDKTDRIAALLTGGALSVVFQPIVDLPTASVAGLEALARFPSPPVQGPELWFAEAWEVGLGIDLEMAALEAAVARVDDVPGDAYLSVNVSAGTLCSGAPLSLARQLQGDRLVVEITEHAAIDEYEPVREAVAHLREAGVRLAVDDVGAGYAGLSQILRLAPDVVKLDMYLSRNIDEDVARQALVASTATFGLRVGTEVVAEGVESRGEAQALEQAGVGYAQGYFFGRPAPLQPAHR